MPLIKLTQKGAEAIAQSWTFMSLENMDETPPEGLGVTMPLAHYLDDSVQPIGTNSVGVRPAPDDDASLLEPHLESLQLIEITFPKYVDGRGFSQAQLLRRRYGYTGEIRAVGQVLRDEIDKMVRCGFDAFELSDDVNAPADVVIKEASRYANVYQPAANGATPIFGLRHARSRARSTAQ